MTRKDAELVRYVRASLTEDGEIYALQVAPAQTSEHRAAETRIFNLARIPTKQQPVQTEINSPIQEEVQEEQVDLMDHEDSMEWDTPIVLEIPKNRVCRLCGQQARNMINMFGQDDNLDMADKINSILPIHVMQKF